MSGDRLGCAFTKGGVCDVYMRVAASSPEWLTRMAEARKSLCSGVSCATGLVAGAGRDVDVEAERRPRPESVEVADSTGCTRAWRPTRAHDRQMNGVFIVGRVVKNQSVHNKRKI